MAHPNEIDDGDKLFFRAGRRQRGRPDRLLSYVLHPGAAKSELTIFFAHGGGGNKHQWRHQWRHLVNRGVKLVAWDALGHGESVQPRDWRSFAVQFQLADFLEVLERFGTRRNLIVAHSFAARLTLAALQHLKPRGEIDRVTAAVLLGAPSLTEPLGGGMLAVPAFIMALMRNSLADRFNRLAWHPEADPALVAYERKLAKRNRLLTMKALVSQAPLLDPGALAHLNLPIEIVAGDSDGLTPASHARELQSLLPDARVHLIERCGHQLMLERPDAINAILDEAIIQCEVAAPHTRFSHRKSRRVTETLFRAASGASATGAIPLS
jgi:pimeloyl-ACP methyl ester carboxylesterase